MTVDLVAFLNARLDEDEATAKAATPGPWSRESSWGEFLQTPEGSINGDGYARAEDVIHQARWDPARVLREVEAKRRILARYEELFTERKAHPHDLALAGALLALDGVVRALAAVWSDHPDYDPAWA